MVTPTWSLFSSPTRPLHRHFLLSYLFSYFDINLLSSCPQTRLFKHGLFSSTSQVAFTETSVPPLQFASWKQGLDIHHSFQVMSLSTDLYIDKHHGATSS